MTQQQSQSQTSQQQSAGQDASLASPGKPDATSPYKGPADEAKSEHTPERVVDADGPAEMAQPYFSEAQSSLGAFEPTERPGDPFAQPEDATGGLARTEQASAGASTSDDGAEFATPSGIVRAGMTVVDSYGHTLGTISSVEGERMRLASTDPHDDGVAFLPVSLIDGVEEDRVLLSGRGDASFGMPAD